MLLTYTYVQSEYQRFGQAESCYGYLVLGSRQFLILLQLSQNTICFKSGQKRLENNHLASSFKIPDTICILKTSKTFDRRRRILITFRKLL